MSKEHFQEHLQKSAELNRAPSTSLSGDEIQLRQLFKMQDIDSKLKAISNWMTFMGVLQIIAIIGAIIMFSSL